MQATSAEGSLAVTSYRSKGVVSRLVIIALVWVFILPLADCIYFPHRGG